MEPDLDRQAAALNMMQAGIGSLSGNTINQPTPFDDAKSNYIFGSNTPGHAISQQNRWEKAGGRGAYPVFDESWNPDTTPRIIPFRSDGVYPYMTTPFKKGWMEAGITNPNLGGAKVWNALSIDPTADDFFLRELYNYGKRYFPGYDAEQDEWRHKRYQDYIDRGLEEMPNEGEERYEDYINRGLEEMDTPYTLEADLNLQDVMDAHDALGLDLDTNRFIKRANNCQPNNFHSRKIPSD